MFTLILKNVPALPKSIYLKIVVDFFCVLAPEKEGDTRSDVDRWIYANIKRNTGSPGIHLKWELVRWRWRWVCGENNPVSVDQDACGSGTAILVPRAPIFYFITWRRTKKKIQKSERQHAETQRLQLKRTQKTEG